MNETPSVTKDYFVMLRHPNPRNNGVPLMENDENIAWFETYTEASEAGENNWLGSDFGFVVFNIGGRK